MTRFGPSTTALTLAVLLLAGADCNARFPPFEPDVDSLDSTMTGVACQTIVKCGTGPLTERDCFEAVYPDIAASVERARAAGLTYSQECDGASFEYGRPPEAETGAWLPCEEDCQLFFGEQPEGAACEAYGLRMSDCAQGLVCAPDRTCHRPCTYAFSAAEGHYCGTARGMWFVQCEPGLACGAEGTCEPAAEVGQACDAAMLCAVEGWCDAATDTCVPRSAVGSACMDASECASDLCVDGLCIEAPSFECGRWAW